MTTLTGLTATPSQKLQTPVGDNFADINLIFRPSIQMWFIDVSYQGIEIKGIRICHNINLLVQYSKILNFGLYVEMDGATEPALIDDLSSGRVKLNILGEEELDVIDIGYSALRTTE